MTHCAALALSSILSSTFCLFREYCGCLCNLSSYDWIFSDYFILSCCILFFPFFRMLYSCSCSSLFYFFRFFVDYFSLNKYEIMSPQNTSSGDDPPLSNLRKILTCPFFTFFFLSFSLLLLCRCDEGYGVSFSFSAIALFIVTFKFLDPTCLRISSANKIESSISLII